jgi:pimeloyl-ACP methyl ester carboxylesterase
LRWNILTASIAASVLFSGCVNRVLTTAIVKAPNQRDTPYLFSPQGAKQLQKDDRTYSGAWMISVGPPAAELSVATVAPRAYQVTTSIETSKLKSGRFHIWQRTDWTEPPLPLSGLKAPKGTILVLHGYQDYKESMMHWALYLAQKGYQVVLVDLRGHGRSTGRWIGYGAFEATDLVQVLDFLEARKVLAGPIGVLGCSYGASVGLQLAGKDKRVMAVVAIEPFSNARQAVVDFAHAVVPQLVKDWTPQDFVSAEDRAGALAHFSWNDANVVKGVAQTTAPILYVAAANDHWVPAQNSQVLAGNTRAIHRVMTVSFANIGGMEEHVLLSWILEPIAPEVATWFDECLSGPRSGLDARLSALGFAP